MRFAEVRALRPGVTAVISAHTPRVQTYLHRALDSVVQQERPVDAIAVAIDHDHAGAAATKNRALAAVDTVWTAVLDSDDEWCPEHVAALLAHAEETGADLVYPWFELPVGQDPFPECFGRPFAPYAAELDHRNWIPTTVLMKTSRAWDVGGFEQFPHDTADPQASPCDDWALWRKLRDDGARIEHLPRRTWIWHWSTGPGGNTSGRGDRW